MKVQLKIRLVSLLQVSWLAHFFEGNSIQFFIWFPTSRAVDNRTRKQE